jgi:hypothetical protein
MELLLTQLSLTLQRYLACLRCRANLHDYPAGSLDSFSILGPPGTTASFQMDLGNHAFLNPPIVPGPGGPYAAIPYFLDNQASDGALTVREVSEPCSALLVAFGTLALAIVFKARKSDFNQEA